MNTKLDNTNSIIGPLYKAKTWIKVAGIFSILQGVFMILTIWGILICWMSIWLGVFLFSTAKKIELAHEENNPTALEELMDKLAKYFKLLVVFQVVAAVVGFSSAILIPAFQKASQMGH